MSEDPKTQSIQFDIIKATDLPLARLSGKPPKAYVILRVRGSESSCRTKPADRDVAPIWNFKMLPMAIKPSSTIIIEVKHDSRIPSGDHILARTEVTLENLLEKERNRPDGEDLHISLDPYKLGLPRPQLSISVMQIGTLEAATTANRIVTEDSQQSEGKISVALERFTKFLEILSAIATPLGSVIAPLETAATVIDAVAKVLKEHAPEATSTTTQELAELISGILAFVEATDAIPKIKQHEETVQQILLKVIDCLLFIKQYSSKDLVGKLLTSGKFNEKVDGFRKSFEALQKQMDRTMNIRIALDTTHIVRTTDALFLNQQLEKLQPVLMDTAVRPRCLAYTRTDVVKAANEWALSSFDSQNNFLWLFGKAGGGKTAFATTLADSFQSIGRLGAFVFFDRDVTDRHRPDSMLRTIAYQLALYDSDIGQSILKALSTYPRIAEMSLETQCQKLLVEPLTVYVADGPLLIIIDALDECASGSSKRGFLSVLRDVLQNLPKSVRVLVTSRPESDIQAAFDVMNNVHVYNLDDAPNTTADIKAYIISEMSRIRANLHGSHISPEWPGAESIDSLVDLASQSFTSAVTICKFIREFDPQRRLEKVLIDKTVEEPAAEPNS